MTNIIQQISILVTLVTNWTGVFIDGKELGIVKTNHTVEIVYQGKTNRFELLSQPSSIAVYGNFGLTFTNLMRVEDFILTNYWRWEDVTNVYFPNTGDAYVFSNYWIRMDITNAVENGGER